MNDRTGKFLSDIRSAIHLIEEFCVDTPNLSRYSRDPKTRSAVERQLGIIGEAIVRIRKEDPDKALSSADAMVAFSAQMIDPDNSVDDAAVWTMIRSDMPQLKIEISELLQK
jgi:uncharacterized protein with HEPN domain